MKEPTMGSPDTGGDSMETERRLARLWEKLLPSGPFQPNDSFIDKGADSLDVTELLIEISTVFEVEISAAEFLSATTLRSMAEVIVEKKGGRPRQLRAQEGYRHLVFMRHGMKEDAILFIVPGGTGSPEELLVHMGITGEFERNMAVYGLCSRQDDPYRSSAEMARAYLKEIRQVQKSGPYLILGECGGSGTAFEICRQLEAAGETVGRLVLLDCHYATSGKIFKRRIHNFFRSREFRKLPSKTPRRLLALFRLMSENRPGAWPGLWAAAWNRQWNRFMAIQYHGLPSQWVKEKHLMYWRHVRRQYTYDIPDGILSAPTALVLSEKTGRKRAGKTGWEKKCRREVSTLIVPGDHYSYIRTYKSETAKELERLFSS